MNINQNESLLLKLQGFKTYKELTIIGPFNGLLGIIGRNGSGKTNILESLEFLFNVDPTNNNVGFLNQMFSQTISPKEYSFIKIGLIFKTKNLIYEFSKIVSFTNITEYFLNSKMISFKKFTHEISRLKFDKFKKITSILKLRQYDIFFKPNLIYKLIQNFSNSKEILSETLKTGILIQKLQQNYYFYSNKLKFIVDEKIYILKNIKKLKILKLKKF